MLSMYQWNSENKMLSRDELSWMLILVPESFRGHYETNKCLQPPSKGIESFQTSCDVPLRG